MPDEKPAQPEQKSVREVRTFAFVVDEVRDAEGGRSPDFTVKGHASVFNTWTDLAFFRERIAKGAFDNVLSRDPHVLHLWDHDTRAVLSSTRNKTLELRVDPKGLHFWSRIAPTSYAADLRVLMERGDIDQSSFAFVVADEEWTERTEDGETVVERTIKEFAELFDVTTTAMGAYPTTDSQVAMRTLESARAAGKIAGLAPAETTADAEPETVAAGGKEPPPDTGDGSQASAADDSAGDLARKLRHKRLREVRERAEQLKKAMYDNVQNR